MHIKQETDQTCSDLEDGDTTYVQPLDLRRAVPGSFGPLGLGRMVVCVQGGI